jgi:tartrate-resistant acid phosphatase type 5
MPAFQHGYLLAESKILQHQASAGVKDAKEGSKPEPKELEHGARVIADRIFSRIPMLFISKPDRIVARHTPVSKYMQVTKEWEDQLLAKSDQDLQVAVLQSLVRVPGAEDFVLDHLLVVSTPKSLTNLVRGISYSSNWTSNNRVDSVLDQLARSSADPEVSIAALETVRKLELQRQRQIVEQRLAALGAGGDKDALAKLSQQDEQLMDMQKGGALPSYLRRVPAAFTVKTSGSSIRVLAFGDFGNGSDDQKKTAAAMVEYHRKKPFDFGITGGDNFTPVGMASPDDPRWKTQWEDLYSPMKIVFYPTFGNHDWGSPDSPAAEISFTAKGTDWQMPAPYYTYTAGPVQFFAIDTGDSGDVSAAQMLWLRAELEKSQARWKVVYGHHPPYTAAPGSGENETVVRELMPVLKGRADVYIAGHYHSLEHVKPVDGVNFFISGGGGRPLYPIDPASPRALFAKSVYGFAVMEADDKSFTVRFIGEDGGVLDESTIHK